MSLDPEGEKKMFDVMFFEELPAISADLPTQAEQNEIKINKIQHAPLNMDP